MKKIVVITDRTPTPDNVKGPSALLYHLIKFRPSNIELSIYTTNINGIDNKEIQKISLSLNVSINIIEVSIIDRIRTSGKINRLIGKFSGARLPSFAYYKLSNCLYNKICEISPDLIWIYPHYLIGVASMFPQYKKLVTGPDCSSLHYSRLLRDNFSFIDNSFRKYLDDYRFNLNLEREWEKIPETKMHVVGYTDEEYLKAISPKLVSKFFPHPHYNLQDTKPLKLEIPLKIILSGNPDKYTYTYVEEFTNALTATKSNRIRNNCELTLLGRKWKSVCSRLNQYGYKVHQIDWVEDYTKFIKDFDIQIFPISVGSGTKGKVLDALANGLLCIGSPYAFENIAVEDGKSCLLFNSVNELTKILDDIIKKPSEYTMIAKQGQQNVRYFHNPKQICNDILDWALNDVDYQAPYIYYRLPLK